LDVLFLWIWQCHLLGSQTVDTWLFVGGRREFSDRSVRRDFARSVAAYSSTNRIFQASRRLFSWNSDWRTVITVAECVIYLEVDPACSCLVINIATYSIAGCWQLGLFARFSAELPCGTQPWQIECVMLSAKPTSAHVRRLS